jgi:putative endonuclease
MQGRHAMDCYYVFIVSSPRAGTLRTGLTCNLHHRLERLRGEAPASRAGATTRLVYYEVGLDAEAACRRARQIRHWSRERRERLVDTMNPQRDDLRTRW